MELWQLKQMQSLPLEVKIEKSKLRIKEWYGHYEGNVNVSFSGGKDSTVLLHLVRSVYPDVEAVFVDTGLEYPEIRNFVKTIDNVKWLKPKMRFDEVIKKYGYPVISKDVSHVIYFALKGSIWAINRLKGLEKDGSSFGENSFKNRYIKYQYLLEAPFKISDRCCNYIKEQPIHNYQKQNSCMPFVGLLADESHRRLSAYLLNGCNGFSKKIPSSTPIAFWTEQDVLRYIKDFNIPYSKIYGDIVNVNNQECMFETQLQTTGAKRTGCMFCMFGCHLDTEPNRFQRMKLTHPKQYDYCINKLGLGEVLDYIKVKY